MKVKNLIEHLQKDFKEDEEVAYLLFSEVDVMERAKDKGSPITVDQAKEVLDSMDRHADASLGMTWDTIDVYLDELPE